MAFCTNCGSTIKDGIKFCSNCGSELGAAAVNSSLVPERPNTNFELQNQGTSRQKNQTLATILSVLLVGGGQMYLGQIPKGLVILIGAMIVGGLTWGLAAIPVWILSAYDAYKIAGKINAGKDVGKWEFF